jgi:hypothetical protein
MSVAGCRMLELNICVIKMAAVLTLAILHLLNQTTTSSYMYNATLAKELATFSSYAYCPRDVILSSLDSAYKID